uniref:Neur_chan_memb domain-containing protein n=1 Tax=Steinernema glaseri TaxID=37863 RepID=A0A1I7YTZ6_9BILA
MTSHQTPDVFSADSPSLYVLKQTVLIVILSKWVPVVVSASLSVMHYVLLLTTSEKGNPSEQSRPHKGLLTSYY